MGEPPDGVPIEQNTHARRCQGIGWCGVGPGTFKGFWLGILAFAHGLFEIYLQPSGVCAEISLPRKGYTFATSVGEKGVHVSEQRTDSSEPF